MIKKMKQLHEFFNATCLHHQPAPLAGSFFEVLEVRRGPHLVRASGLILSDFYTKQPNTNKTVSETTPISGSKDAIFMRVIILVNNNGNRGRCFDFPDPTTYNFHAPALTLNFSHNHF